MSKTKATKATKAAKTSKAKTPATLGQTPSTARPKPARSKSIQARSAKHETPDTSVHQGSVRIYQFDGLQGRSEVTLDDGFVALEHKGQESDCWDGMVRLFSSTRNLKGVSFVGVVPLRFVERTGVKAEAWQKLIERQTATDVFIMNPSPSDEALFPNGLSKSYLDFPDLMSLYSKLFKEGGLPEMTAVAPSTCLEMSMAPYMIASVNFWKAFVAYVESSWMVHTKMLSKEEFKRFTTPFQSPSILQGETPRSLFVGRVLPFFLRSEAGRPFRAIKISLPNPERELNAHLKSLRQLKDHAVSQQASWLVQAWLNYRNLYLYQVNGKDWCQKHLPAISVPLEKKAS